MSQHYHTKMVNLADHKKRLTQKLIEELIEVAEDIADTISAGTVVNVKQVGKLEVISLTSKMGTAKFLSIQIPKQNGFGHENLLFVDENPGSHFFFHDDESCPVTVANREQFLSFANHIPEIMEAFSL